MLLMCTFAHCTANSIKCTVFCIDMPITNAVNDLIEKNRSVDEIIDDLLSRPLKREK